MFGIDQGEGIRVCTDRDRRRGIRGMVGHLVRLGRVVVITVAVAGVLQIGPGCAKPLFPRTLDRTQYDQYDRLRGDFVPRTEQDVYGQTQPALRARLQRR